MTRKVGFYWRRKGKGKAINMAADLSSRLENGCQIQIVPGGTYLCIRQGRAENRHGETVDEHEGRDIPARQQGKIRSEAIREQDTADCGAWQ